MSRRTQRIGESVREVLGGLLQRQVKDPRIGFVTITAVRVTPDLSKAHVYYTVLGDPEQRQETAEGLHSASPFLRSELAARMRVRSIPELVFHYDDTTERGERVDRIIHELHRDEGQESGE